MTGASAGIGADMARLFAKRGARVVVVARRADLLETLAADIGGEAVTCDLADRSARDALIPGIEADGPIDVLVNNAGLLDTTAFATQDPSSIDALIDVNLHAPIQLTRAALPAMLARESGFVVDVSSMAGASCTPGPAVYAATKAGLTHFNASLRAELRGTGVRLAVIELGPVDTEMEANLHTHGPTHNSMNRLRALRLIRHLPSERVAAAIVRTVERDNTYLRMPKRAAAFPVVTNLPRQMGRVLLAGVKGT
ncbi:MAG: SDR family NAD(P)-dependent oxidoreductase [Acidimicrobiales bacterium]|nr:SDR family NAD(P)-dependent oxidoreductase [Acidimicrobiales bacterium]